MNIVTLDPSLNCTAVVVNDKKFIYAKEEYGNTKKQNLTKWFEICDPYITYRWTDYPSSKDHSTNEMLKHLAYDNLTDTIVKDILNSINPNEPTKIGIEGYSYSSAAGPLIDLVTISTLLRNKLYHRVSNDLTVYQPASLKLAACKLTYSPINVGKKVIKYEYRNNEGIAGGSFKKHEIYKALIENTNLTCEWTELLRQYEVECFEVKNVPKPIEDMNDAKILYEIIKSSCNSSSVQV
jgi:hypothetical protein